MIIYKMWRQGRTRKRGFPSEDKFMREGWFLFGFIPLYIRDVQNREWK